MKILVQRVDEAAVKVGGKTVGQISKGMLLLVGVMRGDNHDIADWMANKIANLRIFEDSDGKMNLALKDVGGEVLAISQFTLMGDCSKGNRPSLFHAAPPEEANPMYEYFVDKLKGYGIKVETGIFQAEMKVSLINDGPVTFMIERGANASKESL
ncbi:MAG: D-tyrosyl-tRNA(Tyr) deacylase [Lactobacillus sp.]|jgi:D-tyrosyl-tRNA(Tyr) deacylase|nr:D-tyrosyl-tRNA(Tyr) deacylase [Lactobacillus sp.]